MKYLKRSSLFLLILFFGSCITSSFETEEKRISISFEAKNLGTELEIDDSIIEIEEFKFALEQINLYAAEDVILQTRSDVSALIFSYNDQMFEQRLIIEIGLGVSDVLIYEAYEMFLEPLTNTRNILDSDFIGTNANYSLIIKGTIDGNEFDMRSRESFSKNFDLNDVELSGSNETLIIDKSIDTAGVFVGQDGSVLDPRDPGNFPEIANNVEQLLTVRASAGSIF
ncbi:MAG: hypothetical protein JJU37_07830 [Balneolaceae bacterium]|nr:hypothetical protein [Balneolaceae bacterium]